MEHFNGKSRSLVACGLVLGLSLALCGCEEKCARSGGWYALLPVAVYDVKTGDAPWNAEYQAQATGSRSVEVRARVEAIIEKRLYKEGDFVKEGQQLFQLERDRPVRGQGGNGQGRSTRMQKRNGSA